MRNALPWCSMDRKDSPFLKEIPVATFLRLFLKPYNVVGPKGIDYKAFHIDPGMTTEKVEQMIADAAWDEEIVLRVVLRDLPFPVPFGFRKCDWSGWMVHPLPDPDLSGGISG
ncbi:hypothetical protein EAH68_02585 [Corynebacterium hylobatis]|uniref:Uncharacterized protein n=1 Tax=Corynebacterium hylobatis TaxID=1859290 RepID=A0A430I1C6_9CORY|nr:hypothetical protein [Corynebacterium hylobatis]RSZ65653.1 hypothetical protein EAH68_02585 [Corynebacterium hylobatis]